MPPTASPALTITAGVYCGALQPSLFVRTTARLIWGAVSLLFGLTGRHARLGCRWHLQGPLHEALLDRRQMILVCWHQDVLPMFHYLAQHTFMRKHRPFRVLASKSIDGQITEDLLRPWGFRFVRGSTGKKGARAALRGFLDALEAGESAVIVADGPGPPAYLLQPGPLFMARRSGVPVYVVRGWARPQTHLYGTWFRLAIPLPFCDIAVFSDGPIPVDGTIEEARQRVQDRLNRLCVEADAYLYGKARVKVGMPLDRHPLLSHAAWVASAPQRALQPTWTSRPPRPDHDLLEVPR